MAQTPPSAAESSSTSLVGRTLDAVERIGNRLPDPAVLFLLLMLATWAVSALMSTMTFSEIDPRSGQPVQVVNLLSQAMGGSFQLRSAPGEGMTAVISLPAA